MRILKNKNNKGLTLIEILVSFVVGSIMMIAIYFSYSIFASSYLAIIEKPSVKNLFWSAGYNKKNLRGGVVVGRLGGNIRNNFLKKLTFFYKFIRSVFQFGTAL